MVKRFQKLFITNTIYKLKIEIHRGTWHNRKTLLAKLKVKSDRYSYENVGITVKDSKKA